MARHVPLFKRTFWVLLALVVMVAPWARPSAQSGQAPAQKQDAEYTALIKQYLTDPRISTELVDHLPASDKVPTPLKFLGRVSGQPGYLTYAKEIHAYMKAIADAAPTRAKFWVIGQTEEGRDQIVLAVVERGEHQEPRSQQGGPSGADRSAADDRSAGAHHHRARQADLLADERRALHRARRSGNADRARVPAGRLKRRRSSSRSATTWSRSSRRWSKSTAASASWTRRTTTPSARPKGCRASLGIPYWGKYVAHDNNRDGMGQFLAMTKNVMKVATEWKPTVLHDLHEAAAVAVLHRPAPGPYNEQLDPITIGEWWMFAQNDVMEMTKRGVPGVWTYGFYDGWTPNYMFYAVHTHNATGRFYEVGGYGVNNVTPRSASGAPAATAAPAAGGRWSAERRVAVAAALRPARLVDAVRHRRRRRPLGAVVAVADAVGDRAASGSVRIRIPATWPGVRART